MQPEERDKETPQNNLERLKSHLKKDSLAEKLVSARIGAEGSDPRPALREVVMNRIEELRRGYELPDRKA
ncbi:hypothetical protein [Bradyrhizobium sp. CCBAU 53421]|uniref:hypothetical protein n=1 Tax=Bradyrhizobium sp. CCBAU 53421 TaxID=1325120 RepID=UPI001889DC89|nr:hypothetical protein [Bradyrhizobium sp. CCBAU 53421]